MAAQQQNLLPIPQNARTITMGFKLIFETQTDVDPEVYQVQVHEDYDIHRFQGPELVNFIGSLSNQNKGKIFHLFLTPNSDLLDYENQTIRDFDPQTYFGTKSAKIQLIHNEPWVIVELLFKPNANDKTNIVKKYIEFLRKTGEAIEEAGESGLEIEDWSTEMYDAAISYRGEELFYFPSDINVIKISSREQEASDIIKKSYRSYKAKKRLPQMARARHQQFNRRIKDECCNQEDPIMFEPMRQSTDWLVAILHKNENPYKFHHCMTMKDLMSMHKSGRTFACPLCRYDTRTTWKEIMADVGRWEVRKRVAQSNQQPGGPFLPASDYAGKVIHIFKCEHLQRKGKAQKKQKSPDRTAPQTRKRRSSPKGSPRRSQRLKAKGKQKQKQKQ